jgi:hypothetical protein
LTPPEAITVPLTYFTVIGYGPLTVIAGTKGTNAMSPLAPSEMSESLRNHALADYGRATPKD